MEDNRKRIDSTSVQVNSKDETPPCINNVKQSVEERTDIKPGTLSINTATLSEPFATKTKMVSDSFIHSPTPKSILSNSFTHKTISRPKASRPFIHKAISFDKPLQSNMNSVNNSSVQELRLDNTQNTSTNINTDAIEKNTIVTNTKDTEQHKLNVNEVPADPVTNGNPRSENVVEKLQPLQPTTAEKPSILIVRNVTQDQASPDQKSLKPQVKKPDEEQPLKKKKPKKLSSEDIKNAKRNERKRKPQKLSSNMVDDKDNNKLTRENTFTIENQVVSGSKSKKSLETDCSHCLLRLEDIDSYSVKEHSLDVKPKDSTSVQGDKESNRHQHGTNNKENTRAKENRTVKESKQCVEEKRSDSHRKETTETKGSKVMQEDTNWKSPGIKKKTMAASKYRLLLTKFSKLTANDKSGSKPRTDINIIDSSSRTSTANEDTSHHKDFTAKSQTLLNYIINNPETFKKYSQDDKHEYSVYSIYTGDDSNEIQSPSKSKPPARPIRISSPSKKNRKYFRDTQIQLYNRQLKAKLMAEAKLRKEAETSRNLQVEREHSWNQLHAEKLQRLTMELQKLTADNSVDKLLNANRRGSKTFVKTNLIQQNINDKDSTSTLSNYKIGSDSQTKHSYSDLSETYKRHTWMASAYKGYDNSNDPFGNKDFGRQISFSKNIERKPSTDSNRIKSSPTDRSMRNNDFKYENRYSKEILNDRIHRRRKDIEKDLLETDIQFLQIQKSKKLQYPFDKYGKHKKGHDLLDNINYEENNDEKILLWTSNKNIISNIKPGEKKYKTPRIVSVVSQGSYKPYNKSLAPRGFKYHKTKLVETSEAMARKNRKRKEFFNWLISSFK